VNQGSQAVPRRIIRLPAVLDKTGSSKSTIRREEIDGRFPRRVQTSKNCVGWFEDEVDAYLEALPRVDLTGIRADDDEAQENVLTDRPVRRGRLRRKRGQRRPEPILERS
jgi:prophage regulatory protein